ncbi:hypothetical protein Goshw_015995 [Gossypium schwendimanii]|uniref:Uncharacterized protein n=1 Tax=Gossypium schwendimanii TaxID=34291 RepID=A0A7J9M4G2_GOSSC|nr:hypothetical protein [Gossypium schwendimanii]
MAKQKIPDRTTENKSKGEPLNLTHIHQFSCRFIASQLSIMIVVVVSLCFVLLLVMGGMLRPVGIMEQSDGNDDDEESLNPTYENHI